MKKKYPYLQNLLLVALRVCFEAEGAVSYESNACLCG